MDILLFTMLFHLASHNTYAYALSCKQFHMDTSKEPKSYTDQQRIEILRASIASLEAKHAQLERDLTSVTAQLIDNPDTTCKRYTQLLHEYNDIKDVGQGLMGLLAEARGARQIEVEKEFGVSDEI
ncbi:hypothetical protein PENVUL_c009G09176 [Penicillium vulpinum]|uniref:Swi5-domain-containing protein n=1 Tax=Penicillium vulpinum TaxID=29845 RepID=A0A1V6S497_9EURO|nr:hypothetical protein PENVUL_c009G09176 [Penicillium vulpinum]